MSRIWHPFTQHALSAPPLHIVRGEGACLYDHNERRILDGISSWWVNTHGHCHPYIVQAVQAQADTLDQVIFAGFTHQPAENLAEKLCALTGHDRVFFSDSGSICVEVGVKMAIGYWAHRGEKRRRVIALEGGYHGDTFGAMSLGARGGFNDIYEDLLFDVTRVPLSAEALETELKKGGVAAFVFEPRVLGAGGMIMYPESLLKEFFALCKKYGALLIADEVMTGWGRTGTMFACPQKPDILCTSKGLTGGFLPLAATLCTEEIFNAFYAKDRRKTFFHSSSYTANPLACAAAVANIEIWEKEPVLERIAEIAAVHQEEAPRYKGRAQNIRQTGTIFALDVPAKDGGYFSDLGPRLYNFFLERGVLLRPLGNTIYILPPYCMTKGELHEIHNAVSDALDDIGHAGA